MRTTENIVEKSLSIPVETCLHEDLEAGNRVRFHPSIEEAIVEYYKENMNNTNSNEKWLKIGKRLSQKDKQNKWFSLLHIADERSAYPIGTAIIEIDVNEDIEIRGDILIPHQKYSDKQIQVH